MTIAQELREERRKAVGFEGPPEGDVEGRLERRRQTVLRLLDRRFGAVPEAVRHRVRVAGAPELDTLLDRALDASTLDAVLASLR
jgi:hypothetical protein